jgi:hypothetical protein
MFSLLRVVSRREVVTRHLPVVGVSLVTAELFYHFGSFTIEALAFLGTWYVTDFIREVIGRLGRPRARHTYPR